MIDVPLERTFFNAGALKALGEGRVGGYLAVWGSPEKRDLQGEYFTPETDFALDWYPTRPVLFHHGLDENVKAEDVGVITAITPDEQGLYAEAVINLDNPFGLRVYRMCEQGRLGWSSGSAPNLVEITEDGQIKRWPIVEGSLTPSPAEPRRTTVQALKSAIAALESAEPPTPEEPTAKEGQGIMAHMSALLKLSPMKIHTKRGKSMDLEKLLAALEGSTFNPEQQLEITKLVAAAYAEGAPESDAMMAEGEEPVDERDEAIASDDEDMYKADGEEPKDPAAKAKTPANIALQMMRNLAAVQQQQRTAPSKKTLPGVSGKATADVQIKVMSKYDHLNYKSMSFVKCVMDAAHARKGGWQAPPEFWQALADKMSQASQVENVSFSLAAVKAMRAIKSNELNYSTQAGFGDEFVPELWRAQLWEKPRIDNVVAQNTIFIPMPSDPYKVPIEYTDPTVYAVPQTTNEDQLTLDSSNSPIPDSKVGTDNATLTSGKLGLRVGIAEELNEDSIIPVGNQWQSQAVRAMEDARDNVLLNADATTDTTNINYDGSATAATDKFRYGGGDGFLHLPLVDNTALLVNAGGSEITLQMMRQARGKLGRPLINDLTNLMWVVDPLVYVRMLNIDEINIFLNNGRDATVNTGQVGRIDNVPVFVSNEIAPSASNGKVSSTSGNNTYGRALLVHKPSWYAGYRREIRVNFDYMAVYDSWQLVVTMRMALAKQRTDCASLIYGLSV